MSIPEAIDTVSSLIGLADAISDAGRQDREERRALRPIIAALRGIYFTPRGTQRILSVLASGDRPDPDDIQDIMTAFNDAEWHVERHTRRLDFDYLSRFDISLRQRNALQKIAWGKLNLRRDLQNVLNEALTDDIPVDSGEVTVLLKRVEALNRLIEALEEEFL